MLDQTATEDITATLPRYSRVPRRHRLKDAMGSGDENVSCPDLTDQLRSKMAGGRPLIFPNVFSLPWEDVVFLHIFPHFTIPQLFKFRRVCRFCRDACDSYFAWQRTLDCSRVSSRLTSSAFTLMTKSNSCLRTLVLKNCKSWLCDDVLVEILKRNTRLYELDLTACSSLTNLTLFTLADFNPGLKVLKLRECRWVSSDAITQLSLCCNGLQYIDLAGCWDVSDSCVSSLASCCNELQIVVLNDCYAVSDNCIRIVANSCPHLTHLGLRGCWRVSNSAVKLVGEYCPSLSVLEVKDCRDISEASLARLRIRGVQIDVEKAKWQRMAVGLNEFPQEVDWRIPVVNLNI